MAAWIGIAFLQIPSLEYLMMFYLLLCVENFTLGTSIVRSSHGKTESSSITSRALTKEHHLSIEISMAKSSHGLQNKRTPVAKHLSKKVARSHWNWIAPCHAMLSQQDSCIFCGAMWVSLFACRWSWGQVWHIVDALLSLLSCCVPRFVPRKLLTRKISKTSLWDFMGMFLSIGFTKHENLYW